MNLDSEQYRQVVKIVQSMEHGSTLIFGTLVAFNDDNRTMKVVLEPNGIETGWCKCLQGAFSDKVGIELLLGRVIGGGTQQYVVLGIIE